MNKQEFESVLQGMGNQETVAVSNLSTGYNQTNEQTLRTLFNGVNRCYCCRCCIMKLQCFTITGTAIATSCTK